MLNRNVILTEYCWHVTGYAQDDAAQCTFLWPSYAPNLNPIEQPKDLSEGKNYSMDVQLRNPMIQHVN